MMVKVKILQSKWSDLSSKQRTSLLKMTCSIGFMRDYARHGDTIIFSAYLPSYFGKKVGWAAYSLKHKYAMFFVESKYRRLGIADELMKNVLAFAKKYKSKVIVFPHDSKSDRFFSYWSQKKPEVIYGSILDLRSKFKSAQHYYCSDLAYKRAFR